jgi:hypothetical protein
MDHCIHSTACADRVRPPPPPPRKFSSYLYFSFFSGPVVARWVDIAGQESVRDMSRCDMLVIYPPPTAAKSRHIKRQLSSQLAVMFRPTEAIITGPLSFSTSAVMFCMQYLPYVLQYDFSCVLLTATSCHISSYSLQLLYFARHV